MAPEWCPKHRSAFLRMKERPAIRADPGAELTKDRDARSHDGCGNTAAPLASLHRIHQGVHKS